MRLNHPGIYRIVGEKFELLANIVGEAAMSENYFLHY